MISLSKNQEKYFWSLLWFWALTQGLSTSLSIISSLAMMVFSVWMLFSWRKEIVANNPGTIYKIFCAFSLMMLITLIINRAEIPDFNRSLSKLRYFLLPILALPWLLVLKPQEGYRAKLIDTLVLLSTSYAIASVAGLISIFGCFQVNHWLMECTERAPGLTGIMQYAFETPLVLLLALQTLFSYKNLEKKKKWLLETCIILMFMGLLMSNSRGALAGLIVGLIPWALMHLRKFDKKFFMKFSFFGGIIFLACYLMRPEIFHENRYVNRAADMTSRLARESTNVRMILNKKSLEAFRDRPLSGFGLLNPKNDYNGKTSSGMYYFMIDTHNTYTQVLVDGGIIAFALYMAFWILLLWKTLKSKSDDVKLFIIPWLIFAATSLVHTMFVTGTGTAVLLLIMVITNIVLINNKPRAA